MGDECSIKTKKLDRRGKFAVLNPWYNGSFLKLTECQCIQRVVFPPDSPFPASLSLILSDGRLWELTVTVNCIPW